MELKTLLDQPSKLPTIPKVAQQLIESFSSEEISVNEIARQMSADPALSAKVLRLANSAYFHVSRSIGTVDDALRMLGFVMVRNLVLGNGMMAAFRNTPGIDLKQFWLYNLYTASAARWLAAQARANADLVFTVGLMHGVGQLQMHAAMAKEVAPLDDQMSILDAARAELEKNAFGFHYGDVAAELALVWHLPGPIVLALRDVPQPLASQEFSEAAAWVHMGAWRARCEVLGLSAAQIVTSYPAQVGKRLELSPAWMAELSGHYKGPASAVMPPLKELIAGLEAMLD